MRQGEHAGPAVVDDGGSPGHRRAKVQRGVVVGGPTRRVSERDVGGVAVRPRHVDRRGGLVRIAGRGSEIVHLRDDEVPLGGIAAVAGERPVVDADVLKGERGRREDYPRHHEQRRGGDGDQAGRGQAPALLDPSMCGHPLPPESRCRPRQPEGLHPSDGHPTNSVGLLHRAKVYLLK